MSRLWMPLYIGEYLADTLHLTAAQHGAYLLLIMHYWEHGGLPEDDENLARIAHMRIEDWRRHRGSVGAFFQPRWRHPRIDRELHRAAEISNKRSAAAKQMHNNRSANAAANAQQMHTHARASLQSQLHSEPNGSAPPTQAELERELFKRGRQVCGKNSGGLISALLKAKQYDVALARSVIELASTKADPREFVAAASRTKNGAGTGGTAAAFDDLISRLGDQEREGGPVIEHDTC